MSFFKARFVWAEENCEGIKFDVNVLHQTTHKKISTTQDSVGRLV